MTQTQLDTPTISQKPGAHGHIVIAAWSRLERDQQDLLNDTLTALDYESMNLGITVSAKDIVDQARSVSALAIACLVHAMDERQSVEKVMEGLRTRGLSIPVLLLGEAVDQTYAQTVALPERGELYRGGVYYCENEDEMLQVINHIILFTPPPVNHEHEHEEDSGGANSCSGCSGCGEDCALSYAVVVEGSSKPPSPPFWGYRTEIDVPLDEIFTLVEQQKLFERWIAIAHQGSDLPGIRHDFDVALNAVLSQLNIMLKPRVLYGYLPVQSDGNQLVVYDFENPVLRCELGRLTLPRNKHHGTRNPAGYFASVDSHCIDVVAIQAVTFDELTFDESEIRFDHLSLVPLVFAALLTAMSAWMSQRIRLDLTIPPQKGALLTWGNNASPRDVEARALFELLPLTDALGLSMTASGEILPAYTEITCLIHGMNEANGV